MQIFSVDTLGGVVHVHGDSTASGLLSLRLISDTGGIQIDGHADGLLSLAVVDALASIQIAGRMGGQLFAQEFDGTLFVGDEVSGLVWCIGGFNGAMDFGSLSGSLWLPYPLDREHPMTGSVTVNGNAPVTSP